MSTTRKLAAILTIGALAAPAAAQAQPADMHASTATALAQAQQKQDLRSPDARDAALHTGNAVGKPMGTTVLDSASMRPSTGQPVWPANPQPVTPAPATPVADDGNPVDWPTIALGIAGSLIAVIALGAVMNRRTRRTQRVRVAA